MGNGEFRIDASSLNRIGQELKGFEKQMPGAAAAAINRTLDYVVSNLGKVVAEQYNIKASDFKKKSGSVVSVNKKYARKGELGASIRYSGRRLTFIHFQLTPKVPNTGRPVKVKIKKTSGKKTVNTDPKAFIAPTGAKSLEKVQYNAFQRVGDRRKPISVMHTVSAPQMIGNPIVSEKINHMAEQKLMERVEHEIDYRLQKLK